MLKLRDYQEHVKTQVRDSFMAGNRSPLLVLPTGSGKTVIFSDIANETAARGKRVLILVHRIELLRQTSAALKKSGVEHGLINAKFTPKLTANVQVASVQTLIRRLHLQIPPDLIIIDEAHHATAGTWKKVCDYFPKSFRLGVTATPERADGTGLSQMFDDIIIGPQISEFIDRGFLVGIRLYGSPHPVDFSKVKKIRGDYDKTETVELMDRPTITGSAVSEYTKLCPGVPAVAFCISIKHAEHVAQDFRNAGYRAYSVDGTMDDKTRTRILDGLGNGSVQVVTSCDLISEGTDIPRIICGIMLRPTHSKSLYIQQGGRTLRPIYADGFNVHGSDEERLMAIAASNKPNAIILDHVGNWKNHGKLDDDREWTLEGRKKGQRKSASAPVINVTQCEDCYLVYENEPACPYCGFVNKQKERDPLVVEGELQEIKAEEKRRKEVLRRTEVAKIQTLEDLTEYGKLKGYKPGWAKHIFKARQAKKVKKENDKLL